MGTDYYNHLMIGMELNLFLEEYEDDGDYIDIKKPTGKYLKQGGKFVEETETVTKLIAKFHDYIIVDTSYAYPQEEEDKILKVASNLYPNNKIIPFRKFGEELKNTYNLDVVFETCESWYGWIGIKLPNPIQDIFSLPEYVKDVKSKLEKVGLFEIPQLRSVGNISY